MLSSFTCKPPRAWEPTRLVTAFVASAIAAGCTSAEAPTAVSDSIEVAPGRGSQAGGDAVRIIGDGFTGHGPVVVYFGQRAGKAIVIASPWLITVLSPQSDEPGPVDVHVRFGDGEQRVIEEAFTYESQPGIVLRPEIGG